MHNFLSSLKKGECFLSVLYWLFYSCVNNYCNCVFPVHQTLQADVSEWQERVDEVKDRAGSLTLRYHGDDTSLINIQLEKVMARWTAVLNK